MPLLNNAKKALRASKKKALFNQVKRSQARTTVAAFKAKPTKEGLAQAFSALDKAVKRNIFHKNKVARVKSQLAKLLVK